MKGREVAQTSSDKGCTISMGGGFFLLRIRSQAILHLDRDRQPDREAVSREVSARRMASSPDRIYEA